MKPITVIATMKAKPGRDQALQEALLGLIAPTRLEPGCLHYDLHQAKDNPGQFLFFERWASKRHLDDHLARPHLTAFLARAGELLAEPPQITLWEKIG